MSPDPLGCYPGIEGATIIGEVGARQAAQHLIRHRMDSCNKGLLAPNVNSAKVKKPCCRGPHSRNMYLCEGALGRGGYTWSQVWLCILPCPHSTPCTVWNDNTVSMEWEEVGFPKQHRSAVMTAFMLVTCQVGMAFCLKKTEKYTLAGLATQQS